MNLSAGRRVTAGDDIVRNSLSAFEEIIAHIDELSQTMDEIAVSSAEQATGVDELNDALARLDSTTRQNATTGEELACTSGNLRVEAGDLAGAVVRFKVAGGDDPDVVRLVQARAVNRNDVVARPDNSAREAPLGG